MLVHFRSFMHRKDVPWPLCRLSCLAKQCCASVDSAKSPRAPAVISRRYLQAAQCDNQLLWVLPSALQQWSQASTGTLRHQGLPTLCVQICGGCRAVCVGYTSNVLILRQICVRCPTFGRARFWGLPPRAPRGKRGLLQ